MRRELGRPLIVSLCTALAVTLLLVAAGCQADAPPVLAAPPPPMPVAIAVMEDKTGSAKDTRTPRCTMAHLDALIAIVRRRGGELTYGTVTEDSDRVLHRLTITAAPAPPVKPSAEGNPFAAREAMQGYRTAKADYDRRLAAWQTEVDARIGRFRSEVEPLLALPPNARRSDVLGGVARADLFLAEAGSGRAPYLLLISDGLDNVHRQFPGLQSRATLLLVNGVGSVGSLADLKPVRFEAIDPAVRYLEDAK